MFFVAGTMAFRAIWISYCYCAMITITTMAMTVVTMMFTMRIQLIYGNWCFSIYIRTLWNVQGRELLLRVLVDLTLCSRIHLDLWLLLIGKSLINLLLGLLLHIGLLLLKLLILILRVLLLLLLI